MYKRKEIIGDCELYLGDCMDVMPLIGKVDAVVTDPPYLFDAKCGGLFRSNRACMEKIIKSNLHKGFDHTFIKQSLCDSVVVFCHNDQLATLIPYLQNEFDKFCLCFWHKENPMPVANKHYKPDTEIYIHAWNDKGSPVGELKDKGRYFFAPVGKSDYDHPTVKPLDLMEKIIRNTNGQTILDPFMGSGTTGVACVKLGRKFIGIELDEGYFDIACKRIEEAYKQPDLFIEPPPKPKQETLL